ncbi:MAG: hypothetical protein ACK5Z5_06640 [Neisseriaceae bacterium]
MESTVKFGSGINISSQEIDANINNKAVEVESLYFNKERESVSVESVLPLSGDKRKASANCDNEDAPLTKRHRTNIVQQKSKIQQTLSNTYIVDSHTTIDQLRSISKNFTRLHIVGEISIQLSENIPEHIKIIAIENAIQVNTVASFPNSIERIDIIGDIDPDIIRIIPKFIGIIGLGGEVAPAVVDALHNKVYRIELIADVIPTVITAMYDKANIKVIGINHTTKLEIIKILGPHVTCVCIRGDITADIIQSIPKHITRIAIGWEVGSEAIKNPPSHLKQIDIGRRVRDDSIQVIADNFERIGFSEGMNLEDVKLLTEKVIVSGKKITYLFANEREAKNYTNAIKPLSKNIIIKYKQRPTSIAMTEIQ